MKQTTRITSLNIAVAQLTSTLLLPIIWFLIGTIAKWLLVDNETVSNNIALPIYYALLITSYYVGLKYSFRYVSKNLVVTQPKTSAKISIFIFYLGLLSVYFAFYFFYEEHNHERILAFIILAYMYTTMTNKYFSSLEPDSELNEYSFILQVCFTIVNILLVVMFAILAIWLMMEYNGVYLMYVLIIVYWMGDDGYKINDFLFIPYFYKDGESKPYKKIIASLLLSVPINIFLFYMISMGALSKV